jgi:ribosomal protein S18 acetylase RimI-like enzyme
MPRRLHIDGTWPGILTFKRGWAHASARPWNDAEPHAAVRLHRGSHDFLHDVSEHLANQSATAVFSPALYEFAARIWRRAGFESFIELDILERPILARDSPTSHLTAVTGNPDLTELAALDRKAFEGFWQLSAAGLGEAMHATPRAIAVEARDQESLVGYAVVGTHLNMSFLQRIAVDPRVEGKGFGSALLQTAMDWAVRRGARSMVLNVQPENRRARSFYEGHHFKVTGSRLRVMRFGE